MSAETSLWAATRSCERLCATLLSSWIDADCWSWPRRVWAAGNCFARHTISCSRAAVIRFPSTLHSTWDAVERRDHSGAGDYEFDHALEWFVCRGRFAPAVERLNSHG